MTTTTKPHHTRSHPGATAAAHAADTSGRPEQATRYGQHQQAARQAVDANSSHVRFRLGDTAVDVTLPPLDKITFYAGLSAAVALGIIEWPIAALTGLGHLLTDDRRNRTLHALGEALDAA